MLGAKFACLVFKKPSRIRAVGGTFKLGNPNVCKKQKKYIVITFPNGYGCHRRTGILMNKFQNRLEFVRNLVLSLDSRTFLTDSRFQFTCYGVVETEIRACGSVSLEWNLYGRLPSYFRNSYEVMASFSS